MIRPCHVSFDFVNVWRNNIILRKMSGVESARTAHPRGIEETMVLENHVKLGNALDYMGWK